MHTPFNLPYWPNRKIKRFFKNKWKKFTYLIFHRVTKYFPGLFDRILEIEDVRKKSKYKLTEIIMAGIAMFIFKEGSRNAFNNDRSEGNFNVNYQKIFNLRLPHMDTVDNVMRLLKENELEVLKTWMIKIILTKKTLHKFRFLNKYHLVAIDGSGMMSHSEKHCDHCLTKTSKNGKTTYFHNVLEAKIVCHNGFSISLGTEHIENPSGDYDKQDCELKAFRRLAEKLKKMYPRLPICITADGLYPNNTFFDICQKNHYPYIVTFKDGNLPTVWGKVEDLKDSTPDCCHSETIKNGNVKIRREYRWVNAIDYHGHIVNQVECDEAVTIPSGKIIKKHFVFLTSLEVMRINVSEICQSGRLRWKIENEGFNTQKNHGYNMKHKYSRVSWRAAKNYYQCLQIGHLINMLIELSSDFKKFLISKMTVKKLWEGLRGFLKFQHIDKNDISSLSQLRTQIRLE